MVDYQHRNNSSQLYSVDHKSRGKREIMSCYIKNYHLKSYKYRYL